MGNWGRRGGELDLSVPFEEKGHFLVGKIAENDIWVGPGPCLMEG